MSKRVVVVGGGPGGLAVSMLLARAGASVDIYERMPVLGGRTTTFQQQGFTFDLGPTFFLYPRILDEIFALCGRDLRQEVPMVKLDPQYRVMFEGGGEILATPDIEKLEKAVAAISREDAGNVRQFLADNRSKFAQFEACLQMPFSGWRDVVNLRMMKLLPTLKPWQSLDAHLRKYFKDERVRLSFCFQAKYLGMSPFVCPSLFSILSFLEYEHGVFHPIGGCGAVTKAMGEVAEAMGVGVHLSEPVDEVLFEGRRAVGVRTKRGEQRADAVIVNADFARAMTTLVPDKLRRRWTDAKIAKKKFSCSTFMMYLGIEGREEKLSHHTILLAKDYGRNLADIEKTHSVSENPSIYVQNACVTDPGLAPAGQSTLYVLAPVSHQHENIDWKKEKGAFRETVVRQMEKIGVKELGKRIVYERVITPGEWDQGYNIHLGATFNLAHSFKQMLHLRPQNRFEEFAGMYLVGGGTHPGSGLPVIFESARITSKLAIEDLGLRVDRKLAEVVEGATEMSGVG